MIQYSVPKDAHRMFYYYKNIVATIMLKILPAESTNTLYRGSICERGER